eukprot:c35306_g1_i1 orf=25-699(-)
MEISRANCRVCMQVLVVMMGVGMMGRGGEASDGDPMQDFCVAESESKMNGSGYACKGVGKVKARDFKTTLLREAGNTTNPLGIAASLASAANVGGLNTQGLSFLRVDYAKGGVVPPHVHPRASEVVFVVEGTLQAGFFDTSNTLFSETLKAGELFVIPRGLLHFIRNVGDGKAFSVSSFNSQNPGTSLVANALFGSQPPVPDPVLQSSFQLSLKEVRRLKKVFG